MYCWTPSHLDKGPGCALLKTLASETRALAMSFWNPSHLGQGPWLCPFEVLLHGEEGQHECGVGSKQTTNHRRLLLLPILKQKNWHWCHHVKICREWDKLNVGMGCEIFLHFVFPWIQPSRAPDKQAKMGLTSYSILKANKQMLGYYSLSKQGEACKDKMYAGKTLRSVSQF